MYCQEPKWIQIEDVNKVLERAFKDGLISRNICNDLIQRIDYESKDISKYKKPDITKRNKPYNW